VSEENMELVRGLFAAFEGSPDEGELARRFGDANLVRGSARRHVAVHADARRGGCGRYGAVP
jgi:hypothetical protein